MTPIRYGVVFAIILILSCLVIFKSNGKSARASDVSAVPTFSEDECAYRYITSQPRHWRQMLVKR